MDSALKFGATDSCWEDIVYQLARIGDGEWMEASEADLILLADVDHAEAFMQKLGLLYFIKNHGPEIKELPLGLDKKDLVAHEEQKQKERINRLLDIYNDYRFLYEWFKDEEYAEVMKAVILELKNIIENNKKTS